MLAIDEVRQKTHRATIN